MIRDGMGQSSTALDAESLDLVITNATILDAELGIIKADIGIRAGRVVGIGHAGNPGIQDGIGSGVADPATGAFDSMVIGAGTEVIAGEGAIITAGGIDAHIHFICPQQIDEALASGVTTMLGGVVPCEVTAPNDGATSSTIATNGIRGDMQRSVHEHETPRCVRRRYLTLPRSVYVPRLDCSPAHRRQHLSRTDARGVMER